MEDFIREYKAENTTACKKIIKWFEEHPELHNEGHVGDKRGEKKIDKKCKDSTDISLYLNEVYAEESIRELMEFLWQCVLSYLDDFPILNTVDFSMVERINFQRYKPPTGGFKSWHTERVTLSKADRILTWMIYLNTVDNGGETEFKHLDKKIKAEEGKVLIWPTDFTHEHRGVPSPTGEKYIITGWYNLIS